MLINDVPRIYFWIDSSYISQYKNIGSVVINFHVVKGERVERTLILLKPDAVRRGLVGKIISRFEAKGWQIIAMKQLRASRNQAEVQYAELADREVYPELVAFICSGPLVAMCVEGYAVIRSSRHMIGHYTVGKAAPGTIRGDFATSEIENLIHGSDNLEAAERELKIWFSARELEK